MKTGAPVSLQRVQGSLSFPAAFTDLLHFKEHVACGVFSDVLSTFFHNSPNREPFRVLSAESDWTSKQFSQGLEHRERLDEFVRSSLNFECQERLDVGSSQSFLNPARVLSAES